MNTLQEMANAIEHCKTDKRDAAHTFAGQTYLDVYEARFGRWRSDKFTLLEIGVLFGHSLRLWRDYFANATIIGVDIDPDAMRRDLLKGVPVETYLVDQSDKEAMKRLGVEHGPFRIVIDDGSHLAKHVMTSFDALWERIESGGFYVIEDTNILHSSVDGNWPGMKHNKPYDPYNNRSEFNAWLMEKVHRMDRREGDIRSISFCSQQIVVEKV